MTKLRTKINTYFNEEQDNIIKTILLLFLCFGIIYGVKTLVSQKEQKLEECSKITFAKIYDVNHTPAKGGERYYYEYYINDKRYFSDILTSNEVQLAVGSKIKIKYYCYDPNVCEVVKHW